MATRILRAARLLYLGGALGAIGRNDRCETCPEKDPADANRRIPRRGKADPSGEMRARLKMHQKVLIVLAALITMGLLLMTGELTTLNQKAQDGLNSLGLNFFNNI